MPVRHRSLPRPKPSKTVRDVTRSFAAAPSLFEHLPALFDGIDALEFPPGLVVSAMRKAGIARTDRVLDLGCGKGGTAVALVRGLGCRVVGLDAYAPFIDAARALAERHGVADRCVFRVRDIDAVKITERFDAAIMIGLDGFEWAVPRLRALVKPGGVYAFDDALRAPGSGRAFRGVPAVADVRARVALVGDRVLSARGVPLARARAAQVVFMGRLERNAARIATEHPPRRRALQSFLDGQATAGRWLLGPLRSTLIVVRREG